MKFNDQQYKREIEIKVLEINKTDIEQRLNKLGVRKIFDRVLTKTLVFDHPNLRLRQTGKVLRLRQVGQKVFLSIKSGAAPVSKNPFAQVQESELEISDFTQGFRLLESLGFTAFRYQEKLRTGYVALQGVKIEIDEYPKIPPYLEVSGNDEQRVTDFLIHLGFKLEQTVKMSATEVLRHYGIKDVDIIRFPIDSGAEGIIK